MDVYNYPAYQYNQSDELARQIFAQQTLVSTDSCNRDIPEPHAMPAPSGAPWNVQGVPWGLSSPPQLVQFTAQENTMEPLFTPVIHCKRKSVDVEPVVPAKQLITDEKMAAHLNSLHISSNYTGHSHPTDDLMDADMDTPSTSSAGSLVPLEEKLKGHTIVLSEELKKIKDEPLIPPSLIERLEKPHMSLVVWKPKENILENLKESNDNDKSNIESEEPKKRNGVLVAEPPSMDVEM